MVLRLSPGNYGRPGFSVTGSPCGTGLADSTAGMTDETKERRDEDLARWAKELGVSYEELISTLNYAGPTFKDLTFSSEARRAGSTSIPS